jgi:hypothetical protein
MEKEELPDALGSWNDGPVSSVGGVPNRCGRFTLSTSGEGRGEGFHRIQSHSIAPNQTIILVFWGSASLRRCVIGSPSVRTWKIKRQDAKAQRRTEGNRSDFGASQSHPIKPNRGISSMAVAKNRHPAQ